MGVCATCGNHYDKTFDIVKDGKTTTYDSFECGPRGHDRSHTSIDSSVRCVVPAGA